MDIYEMLTEWGVNFYNDDGEFRSLCDILYDASKMWEKRQQTPAERERLEYGFDSLALRYNAARDAQARLEVIELKKDYSSAVKQANRDKMRFYEILTELIGEHD